MHLELEDLRSGYTTVAREVMSRGEVSAPRGLKTMEVLDATLVVSDAHDLLPVGTGRKINTGLAALEALQLIGGYSDPVQLGRVTANMAKYEDLGQFHGAYGPRVRPQLPAAVARLIEDDASRRAYISIWDPLRDLYVHGMKNYPCTTALQFLIRRDRLVLQVTMRANDVWHGLATDAFVFGQLQCTVANVLGIEVGEYRHHANSLHVYEPQWGAVEELLDAPSAGPLATPDGFTAGPGDPGDVHGAMERARYVAETGEPPEGATASEEWYSLKVAKYVAPATQEGAQT